MWYFSQKTGIIRHNDEVITSAYSGYGSGKNNPADQKIHNIGPIPIGLYQMDEPIQQDPEVGHYAIPLRPSMDNQMFGRSHFLWHGDSFTHPGDASHGCIVSALGPRLEAWESGDHELTVTE